MFEAIINVWAGVVNWLWNEATVQQIILVALFIIAIPWAWQGLDELGKTLDRRMEKAAAKRKRRHSKAHDHSEGA